ncbi:hypothetical protein N234_18777 [Ralstonia pickettii DTP0602]|nr:hypothetical protein N234_18777 [Ralstonia pickettii DTP0602]
MGRVRKRSTERFIGIPHWVMQSAAYRSCPHPARSLLLDIVMQYNGRNNGSLVACDKYLKPLGWLSSDVIARAKDKLLKCGLLVETRKGQRPNKAAWYALGWRPLDVKDGMDINPRAYRTISQHEINTLTPSHGAKSRGIAPSPGVDGAPATPSRGAMRGVFGGIPTPPHGAYLDIAIPSAESVPSTKNAGAEVACA